MRSTDASRGSEDMRKTEGVGEERREEQIETRWKVSAKLNLKDANGAVMTNIPSGMADMLSLQQFGCTRHTNVMTTNATRL